MDEEKFEEYKSRFEPCHIYQLKLLAIKQIAENCFESEEMITDGRSTPIRYLEHRLKMELTDENDGPMWLNRYASSPRCSSSTIQSDANDSKRVKLSPPSTPQPSPTYNVDHLLPSYPQECEDLSQLRGTDENEELQRYFQHGPPTSFPPTTPPSPMSYITDNAVPFKQKGPLANYFSNFA